MTEMFSQEWSGPFADGAIGSKLSTLSRLRELSHQVVDVIDFGVSSPHNDTIPVEALKEATIQAIDEDDTLFRYQGSLGLRRLREAIAAAYSQLGVGPDSILIADGAQHAFFLIVTTLVERGQKVLCEEVTYPGMFHNPLLARAELETIPIADDGLDVDALSARLRHLERAGTRPKLFMVQPICHNPYGYSLDRAKIIRLVELAHEFRFFLVEDCAYYYFRPDLPSLFEAEKELGLGSPRRVIHIGTFSKTLSPGLRKSFIVAEPELLARMRNCRQMTSKHPPGLTDMICALMIEPGSRFGFDYQQWLNFLKDTCQEKLDRAVAYLAARGLEDKFFLRIVPEISLFLYPRLPIEDLDSFVLRALDNGVLVAPDVTFTPKPPRPGDARHFRISLTAPSIDRIEEGIDRLARTLEAFV
jgi:2-aminoadipate transaminase